MVKWPIQNQVPPRHKWCSQYKRSLLAQAVPDHEVTDRKPGHFHFTGLKAAHRRGCLCDDIGFTRLMPSFHKFVFALSFHFQEFLPGSVSARFVFSYILGPEGGEGLGEIPIFVGCGFVDRTGFWAGFGFYLIRNWVFLVFWGLYGLVCGLSSSSCSGLWSGTGRPVGQKAALW